MFFNNGSWFYSMMGGWLTWQWVFLNSPINFWSFDTYDTPGCASVVFADNQSENEIWNRLKHFLPVWHRALSQLRTEQTQTMLIRCVIRNRKWMIAALTIAWWLFKASRWQSSRPSFRALLYHQNFTKWIREDVFLQVGHLLLLIKFFFTRCPINIAPSILGRG